MSENLTFEIGEEVVFCPNEQLFVNTKKRGADGIITNRQTSKKKQKDGTYRILVKSVLVAFSKHRSGVACFRRKGKRRPKSDTATRFWQHPFNKKQPKAKPRLEEDVKHLHPLSYCHDCPLRIHRLVRPCGVSKQEAIAKYGKDKNTD